MIENLKKDAIPTYASEFNGLKIVIIGPESTGKSTLCEKLAQHYTTPWVKEYAREYLLKNGTDYTFENLLDVAKGQVALEDKALKEMAEMQAAVHSPQLLFIDTDMYVMKVWCEFVFGKCHGFITEEIKKRKYDLYLLCQPDLPWVKDELREYPDLETREKLFHIYKNLMEKQSVPFIIINGSYEQRLQKAIAATDELQKKACK